MRLTAEDLSRAIAALPKDRAYHYVASATKTVIHVFDVTLPEGPIAIKRYNPAKGESIAGAEVESVPSKMLWRVANALETGQPVNFDRILAGSYNVRSALEALLAHTPQFYVCHPGRIELVDSTTKIKKGHKHLIWSPQKPHEPGVITEMDADFVISEIPGQVIYEALTFPAGLQGPQADIEIARRHAQIQIALLEIGRALGYKVWIAQNDKGIVYRGQRLGEMEGVVPALTEGVLISAWGEAVDAAKLMDVIYFKESKLMPAVVEIEDTTGVTSGLTRMKKFQDAIPSVATRYIIAAPDEDREKVLTEINRPQFKSLRARFFPYSAVEELLALLRKRKVVGITEEFLDSFMDIASAG
jgi:type II restriction enzyme